MGSNVLRACRRGGGRLDVLGSVWNNLNKDLRALGYNGASQMMARGRWYRVKRTSKSSLKSWFDVIRSFWYELDRDLTGLWGKTAKSDVGERGIVLEWNPATRQLSGRAPAMRTGGPGFDPRPRHFRLPQIALNGRREVLCKCDYMSYDPFGTSWIEI
jgi:hypothetical protein